MALDRDLVESDLDEEIKQHCTDRTAETYIAEKLSLTHEKLLWVNWKHIKASNDTLCKDRKVTCRKFAFHWTATGSRQSYCMETQINATCVDALRHIDIY